MFIQMELVTMERGSTLPCCQVEASTNYKALVKRKAIGGVDGLVLDFRRTPIFDDDQFDDDYEGPPVFDDYPYEEEIVKEKSMSVYDTDIEDVTEEEKVFVGNERISEVVMMRFSQVGKGEFGGEEENIEDVVVVVNDLFSSMIQTTIKVSTVQKWTSCINLDLSTASVRLCTGPKMNWKVEVWEQNRVLAGFGIGGKIGKRFIQVGL
ncbi:hypothetical protein Tco_1457463 [Tanacetum coccineum]